MWPVKNCFVNFFWTFDTVLSISEWFLSDISCGDFWLRKKRYYIFYIAYCGVLIAHWEIFARFFFVSLLNDKFDKKKDTLDCENLWKDAKFSYNCSKKLVNWDWWLFWMQVVEHDNWMKKVDLKVSNLRWDTL
jgi:hypothetical protein